VRTKERDVIAAIRRRLTYANVIATLALVLALGGGAYAAFQLPRNSVRSMNIKNGQVKARDIGNNQVRSSDIKNGQVKSEDIKDGDVTSADIGAGQVKSANIGNGEVASANIGAGQVLGGNIGAGEVKSANIGSGQVGADQLAQPEPFHLVGTTGEPAFGDGGAGDCIWSNFTSNVVPPGAFNPVGFYKDPYGVVRLTGEIQAKNGSGGDGTCGSAQTDGDGVAFILPVADRPPHELIFSIAPGIPGTTPPAPRSLSVNGTTDLDFGGGIVIPAGAVIVSGVAGGTNASLDGVDFRAAGSGTGIP
jgi:hypothetical protein